MKTKPLQLLAGIISKTELALLYFPNVNRESALKSFMSLVKSNPELMKRLEKETHYCKTVHRLTPRQVDLILEMLGNPHSITLGNLHVKVVELSRKSSSTLT